MGRASNCAVPATARAPVRRRRRIGAVLLLCGAAVTLGAAPPRAPTWTDSFTTRLEALAVLQSLNADLLSHDSATLTLERWCDVHKLASPPRIVAVRIPDVDKAPTAEQRHELGVAPGEQVRYRRVRLMCGTLVLSEADNWYVPGRLTPDMNKLLDTTDSPFGVVVRALHFQRHTLASTLLWPPLPLNWEMGAGARQAAADAPMPSQLLQHRALLALPDGTPFSEVIETYTDKVLAFPVTQPYAD
jgi:hypothetical protein